MKIREWGDRLLGAMVPKRAGSAYSCPSMGWCDYVRRGCGGGYCYYYFTVGNRCRTTLGSNCNLQHRLGARGLLLSVA